MQPSPISPQALLTPSSKTLYIRSSRFPTPSELGRHIVVQGGTFYNDAVLRSFEKIADCEAIRPDIAGIMGAFGAALIARERYVEGAETTMLSIEKINELQFTTTMAKCKGCTNNCRLTINRFTGGRQFISGNRCERGLGKEKNKEKIPNLFEYKNKLLFGYDTAGGRRGRARRDRYSESSEHVRELPILVHLLHEAEIPGHPHTGLLTTKCTSWASSPSPVSPSAIPAKLAHGHVTWLIRQGIKEIFYPSIPYERKEFPDANNHYNCPIVTSYPENIKNNIDELRDGSIRFRHPFLNFESPETITLGLTKEFPEIPASEIEEAVTPGLGRAGKAPERPCGKKVRRP